MYRIVHLANGRVAIADKGVLLAVPPLRSYVPRPARERVYELVLRRQFGEAYDLAAQSNEASERGETGTLASIASLMSQTPHKNSRGHVLAA